LVYYAKEEVVFAALPVLFFFAACDGENRVEPGIKKRWGAV
jgi:hypothetical protein